MKYTENLQSPMIHRLWAAITMVGGACERRVWVKTGDYVDNPNLYVLLVAPPGTGKGVIDDVRDLWINTDEPSGGKAFHVASDSMTHASIVDELNKAESVRLIPLRSQSLVYHTLLVPAEEFRVLLPAYETSFISKLDRIWNNPYEYKESRRHGPVKELSILRPQLTILGGAQPAYFASHFPAEAWNTGLIRRIIMVYADTRPTKDIFLEMENRESHRSDLLWQLGHISTLYGQALYTQQAATIIRDWHMSGNPPEPNHPRLVYYNNSRTQFLIKLALISAISRTSDKTIHQLDVTRALEWLLEAESFMPDTFRAMAGKSDTEVLDELHYYITGLYLKSKKGVSTQEIWKFLSQRLPSEKIDKVFITAERINIIARTPSNQDLWLPRPKHTHGVGA